MIPRTLPDDLPDTLPLDIELPAAVVTISSGATNNGYRYQLQGSVDITPVSLEYRINGGAWVTITPADTFDLEILLSIGVNTVEVRANGGIADSVSVTATQQYLLYTGVAGDYVWTPDSALNSPTGDVSIILKLRLPDWTPAANRAFIAKSFATGNQRSFYFVVSSAGNLAFYWSTDGTNALLTNLVSLAANTIPDGTDKWIRVDFTPTNGDMVPMSQVDFYLSDDGVTWTLFETVKGAMSTGIFNGTARITSPGVNQGAALLPSANARLYLAQIYDSFGGNLLVNLDPNDWKSGLTWVAQGTGAVWNLAGNQTITH